MSIHPTTTNAEIEFVCDSIIELAQHHQVWAKDYDYSKSNNEFIYKSHLDRTSNTTQVDAWFDLD